MNWKAEINETDNGLAAYFETSIKTKPVQISDAVLEASQPDRPLYVECSQDNPPTVGLPHEFLGKSPYIMQGR